MMTDNTYSMEIVDAIKDFLIEDDWRFSFDEEKGLFKFGLSLHGKLKHVDYIIDIKEDEYLVYAISSIGADEGDAAMMANMAEFICRANYGLIKGNFELDFRDGEIRYKVHVACEGITPSTEMIKWSVYCPAQMFERYGTGIIDVVMNDASGKDAVEKCEN